MTKHKLPWRFRLPVLIAFIATFVAVANDVVPEKTIPMVFIPVFLLLWLVKGRHDGRHSGVPAPSRQATSWDRRPRSRGGRFSHPLYLKRKRVNP